METTHRIVYDDAADMRAVEKESIDLVVTSPPYPMISVWDGFFSKRDPEIGAALARCDGSVAFSLMHRDLARTWNEVYRVVKTGGVVCINIGDATRKIGTNFQLYQNHVRVSTFFVEHGFFPLPGIIWRKRPNKPTKYMGSGMMPPNAYVTLEHEFILVFRKGPIAPVSHAISGQRQSSAYFWEERNVWFSDLWTDVKGASQNLAMPWGRAVSAAFPLEIANRLIAMFSVQGDAVLDPFLGTGTTMLAAMCLGRNSIGYEIDRRFDALIKERIVGVKSLQAKIIRERLDNHMIFMQKSHNDNSPRYVSERYGFPVRTRQEVGIRFPVIQRIDNIGTGQYGVVYSD